MPRKPMGDRKVFAKNLQWLLDQSGKSDTEVAEAIDIDRAEMSKLRNHGAVTFNGAGDKNRGRRLARLFNCVYESLWSRTGVVFLDNAGRPLSELHEKMAGSETVAGPISDFLKTIGSPTADREVWKKTVLAKASLALDGPQAEWLAKAVDLALTGRNLP